MYYFSKVPIGSILIGGAQFSEDEEYFRFQFRFLFVLLLFGAFSSGLFLLSHYSGGNPLSLGYITAAKIHLAVNVLLAAQLYGKKTAYYWVAWTALINSFMIFNVAFHSVQNDELRVIWFFLNLPAVYLLLGRTVGLLSTFFSAACILIGNRYLEQPYSDNAIITSLVAFVYISAFFYAYSSRSISYFHRLLASKQRLHDLASRDPLTGVLNARAYYAICDKLIQGALRDHSAFSVLFIDLDHFKKINDQYGHEAGDTVLKVIARCLGEQIRGSDYLGRVGGEEFSVFLPHTSFEQAMVVAEKIRAAVEAAMPDIGSQRLRTTASIGVASRQTHHSTMKSIQAEADHAMYAAKKAGRNRVSALSV